MLCSWTDWTLSALWRTAFRVKYDVIDVHLVEECKNLTQDKNVPEKEINKCLLDLVQVAFSCTRSLPSERSNMKQIASEMHAIKVSQLGWMTCKK